MTEEQELAADDVENPKQHGRWMVQSQSPAERFGQLCGAEERVEPAAVAEGDGGEVDIDGAHTVLQASLQGHTHQRRGFEVDLTGQGEQRPCPSVMAVDGELWQGHGASVRKTIRQRVRWCRSYGSLGALPAGAYFRRRQSNGRSDSLRSRTEDQPGSLQGCAG